MVVVLEMVVAFFINVKMVVAFIFLFIEELFVIISLGTEGED
jgi:hypothetical protein